MAGKVGIYAIFDQAKTLQYVGYSRDISVGLTQHLVRCTAQCYWFKVHTVTLPSRTRLEEIRNTWLREYGTVPPGNSDARPLWEKPIDAKAFMTEAERDAFRTEIARVLDDRQLGRLTSGDADALDKVLEDRLDRLFVAKVYLQSDAATANTEALRQVVDDLADTEYEKHRTTDVDGETERGQVH